MNLNMQIAEVIVKQGMAAGSAFMEALTDLVKTKKMTRIIETGTYLGTGTTQAVWSGLEAHGKPSTFVSIEVNPSNHAQAKKNNKHRPIDFLLGLSIPRELLPKKDQITFEGFDESAIVDHHEHNRAKLYHAETAFNVPDKQLHNALELTHFNPNLVILDSAGHVGLIEFNYLMSMVKGNFYLALDDTKHVKHIPTLKLIENDDRFSLTFATEEKFGSRIYLVSSDRTTTPVPKSNKHKSNSVDSNPEPKVQELPTQLNESSDNDNL